MPTPKNKMKNRTFKIFDSEWLSALKKAREEGITLGSVLRKSLRKFISNSN